MNKKLLTVILSLLLVYGCVNDPAQVSPTNQYSTGNYPKSIDGLNGVLAAAYSNLRDPKLFGQNFLPKAIANITHTANANYNGDQSWNEMANMNLSVNNSHVEGAWQVLYTGVKNCNVALNAANFYMDNYAKSGEEQTVDYIRGQAHFLRAYYYFELESLFGEDWVPNSTSADTLGVPIFKGVPSSLNSTQKPRSSITAVWSLIEKDLTDAADLLQDKEWTGDDVGRVTEWSAKALLGKAYVFRKDWNKAKNTLMDIINNSGKSLMSYDHYRASFIDNNNDEFNEESLFEINIDQDSKGDFGTYGDTPNATTWNGVIWSPWALGPNGTVAGARPMGYGNEIFHDKNVLRFGFDIGYYQLVSNPNFDSSQPASYNNPKMIMDPAYKQQALQVRKNNTADPRLFVNALEPRVDSVKYDGQHWFPVSKPNFLTGQEETYGWSMRKYTSLYHNENTTQADASNIYILRLADVYLLYAEAVMNTGGDNGTALEYINKVKRRAYGYPVNTPSSIDYTSLSDDTPAIDDPVLGDNPLYYERWAELFNEGWWWFDVCRWHLGESEANYYDTAYNLSHPIQWDDKSYAWPIPLSEINSNPNLGNDQQNPGY